MTDNLTRCFFELNIIKSPQKMEQYLEESRREASIISQEEHSDEAIAAAVLRLFPFPSPGNIASSVRSQGQGQDMVWHGQVHDYKWAVLMDGHGSNTFKNMVLTMPIAEIMARADSLEYLLALIEQRKFTYGKNSGATLLMMKAYPDRIEVSSIGDSEILIYKNGAVAYKSTPHNRRNPIEEARLSSMNVHYDPTIHPIPMIVSSTKMRGRKGEYAIFSDGTRIAPTQAIGHNSITGFAPERHIEYYDPSRDDVRCILGSDGFFDMFLCDSEEEPEDSARDHLDALAMTAEQLVQKAVDRWAQPWDYHWNAAAPDMSYNTVFPEIGGRDDVSVIVFDNRKAV